MMKNLFSYLSGTAIAVAMLAGSSGPAAADATSDFYKKTRTKVVIGFLGILLNLG